MNLIARICMALVGGWLLFQALGLAFGIALRLGPRGDDGAWMYTVLGMAVYVIPTVMILYAAGCLFWLGWKSK